MLELEYDSKIIKNLLVIKEICSWLPPGLDGRKVCSRKCSTSRTDQGIVGWAVGVKSSTFFPSAKWSLLINV